MSVRPPVVAGRFYEADASTCRRQVQRLFEAAALPDDLPGELFGGLVPHAGWMFSGRLAAMTLQALAQTGPVDTLVLFGADHSQCARQGEVYDRGEWRTPLGQMPIHEELAAALLEAGGSLRANADAHRREHSIEVQVPLIQVLCPEARIVPIAVPRTELATRIGTAVGQVLADRYPAARVVGSTDLTHHGGDFGAPGGTGRVGERWTRANDRRLLDVIEALDAEGVVPETRQRGNACGPGAVAATIAACRTLGATRGVCLEYTNSYEVMLALHPHDPGDVTVGYASVVFA